MASTRDLRRRIASVKNTKQTTKAMKMVSASKLRRAQEAIVGNRPYAKKLASLLKGLSSSGSIPFSSTLLRGEGNSEKKPTVALVIVSSDRGLCGGFNSGINKKVTAWTNENRSKYEEIKLFFIGKKALDFFKSRVNKPAHFEEFGRKAEFLRARNLANRLIDGFHAGEFQEVKVVYNEFKNALSQIVQVEHLLPIHAQEVFGEAISPESASTVSDQSIVKPSTRVVLERLLEKHFAIQLFRIFLESQASEHGSGMSAMDNATRSADEMIQKLTLEYNKQRQSGITRELLEIVAGAESQKNQ